MREEMLTVIQDEQINIDAFFQSLSPAQKAHSNAVSALTEQILMWSADSYAQELKDSLSIQQIANATRYHDIGLVLIPECIFNKLEPLTAAEFRVLEQHAAYGGRLLDKYRKQLSDSNAFASFWRLAAEIALGHHERWDGKGYPFGQRTTATPFVVRVVSIADAFISMVQGSCYRMQLPPEFAMLEIIQKAGKQFDPYLAALFREHYDSIAENLSVYKDNR